MNCQLCQKESDAYFEGKLPEDMKTQVESHLLLCADCAGSYRLFSIADSVMNNEKEMSPDIDLAIRVMACLEKIESSETHEVQLFRHVLRPAIIAASLAAAIFSGVIVGNIYRPAYSMNKIPVELALINDATIESLDLLSTE